jgi:hypothetical protein
MARCGGSDEHAWLGGIDFGYDHPFDELIYLPAAE